MGQKIKLGDTEYDAESLSAQGNANLLLLKFTDMRIQELVKMQAVLMRTKNNYLVSLKKEIISSKSGFLFEEN